MSHFPNTLPFTIFLNRSTEDNAVECERLLRCLPDKRLVYEGTWGKRAVVVKMFLGREASRYWARERAGVEALKRASIATPELLFSGQLTDSTPVLVFDYISDAQTALAVWEQQTSVESRVNLLHRLVALVGMLHNKGLVQEDLHLENFLITDQQVYAIDGDTIITEGSGTPLDMIKATRNLALLFAQLPPSFDSMTEEAARHYVKQRNINDTQFLTQLSLDLPEVRRRRRHKYVKKCYRSCSEFVRTESAGQVAISRRDVQGKTLNKLLADPDAFMHHGELLKDGNTSTVARVQIDGCDWVVKRYNIKSPWHALSRSIRSTRAWTSWGNAHLLKISAIATPRAIAVIEKRIGPLRSTGYYVCDFVAGTHAEEFFQNSSLEEPVTRQVAAKFVHLFEMFHKLKICHGDCKGTNYLLRGDEPWVLDLDAMRECSSSGHFKKLFQIDRQRFLRNWQLQPELQRWFDDHLPGNVDAD